MAISDGSYRADEITKSFAGVRVLHGVDFAVAPGTIHGLFGHNGAGKSTLLRILAGAQPADSGRLSIAGETVSFASPRDALAQGVACVYQELRLLPSMTVAENLFLGRELTSAGLEDNQAMLRYAARLLRDYNLRVSPSAPVKTLSHPEKQMVEVIANLDRKASFLFLDEPTTALDGRQAEEMLAAVRRIALERRIGVVLVSHKLDEVLGVCDEATVMSGGRVVFHGDRSHLSKDAIVKAIVGDAHRPSVPGLREAAGAAAAPTETLLEVSHLSGPRLNDVSLSARRGEILGICGLIGSGRSRFFGALYGTERITGGEVRLGGKPYRPASPRAAIAAGVAFLTEERKRDGFIPLMSACTNVVLPTLARYRKGALVSHAAAGASARATLARMRTRGELDRPIKSLSGGNQQKVLFGRIVEQDARLILLDEPTKGVDIGAKADIYAIIRSLADEGRCVLMISSDEEELLEVCDRIAVFRNGACIEPPVAAAQTSLADLRHAAWTTAA